MILEKIKNRAIQSDETLLSSLKLMDCVGVKLLYVFENEHFLGIVTIGDIQRAIIKNIPLSSTIGAILSSKKVYAYASESKEIVRQKMQRMRAESMPVINDAGELIDAYFWKDFFEQETAPVREKIDVPVVIMAGGKGTRLKPLTNVVPKPLIPVGDKTILEEILNQFESIGCKKFYMSVNYKYDMIEFYLNQLARHYDISFFMEDKPLGTIGSVSLLKDKLTAPFFVSNCDIMIDQDFRDVYEYHLENKNDITIVTAIKSYKIPYGVIKTEEGGLLREITEKPELSYMINTGVYVLNPELIAEIPQGEFFHVTHLMEKIKNKGGRIGCFPVSDGQWRDMGEWPEYLKMINVR